jgi:hypothetical protein
MQAQLREGFTVDHQYRRSKVVTQRGYRRNIKTHQFIPHLDPIANLQFGSKMPAGQIDGIYAYVHQQFDAVVTLDAHRVHRRQKGHHLTVQRRTQYPFLRLYRYALSQ